MRENPVTATVSGDEVKTHPILLYDGVCGLCNRAVQFVLRHDREGVFRFASLQSQLATQILARHGADPTSLDTIYVITSRAGVKEKENDVLLGRSEAVQFVLCEFGGIWRVWAGVLGALPRPVRDWGYEIVARNRYRVFGKYKTCPLPSEETRARFLDI